jgi:putative pre-16S rRNA nuclease
VGLPLRLDGTRGEMAEEVERFAQRVSKQVGVPVEMADERLTSWEAERLMEEEFGRTHRSGSKHSGAGKVSGEISVDAVAAAVILKEYFERHGKSGESE